MSHRDRRYAAFKATQGLQPWTVPLAFPAPNVVWDADFVNDQYAGGTLPAGANNGTLWQQQVVNTQPNYMENADGSLTTFTTIQTVRRTNKGLVSDGQSRTNRLLRGRDLSNVVWTPSNCTPVRNLTGRTQVANSATQITVNANNATLLQSVTLSGSISIKGACDLKRISGSGTCEMTIDGGATWIVMDASVPIFNNWCHTQTPAQTLGPSTANIGYRFSTNGDVWGIDFAEFSEAGLEYSPVGTAAAQVKGWFDRPSSMISDNSVPAFYVRDRSIRCIYMEFAFRTAGGLIVASSGSLLNVRDTDVQGFSGAVTSPNAPVKATSFRLPEKNKVMVWQSPAQTGICLNGGTIATAAGAAPNGATTHWDILTNGSASASIDGLCTRTFGLSAIPPNSVIQAWTT